jgi:hypothetical protein
MEIHSYGIIFIYLKILLQWLSDSDAATIQIKL